MDNLQKARSTMILQHIRPWDVFAPLVLKAMGTVAREHFVPKGYEGVAYADSPIPLSNEQSMLEPKVIARALQALDIRPQDTVLEIGAGTGYVSALLSHLASQVYAIESNETLFKQAQKNLFGFENVLVEQGDPTLGWASHAPYSIIFVGGSYPLGLPVTLSDELALGGRCFAIIGQAPAMHAVLFHKTAQGLVPTLLFECYAPALPHASQPSGFSF